MTHQHRISSRMSRGHLLFLDRQIRHAHLLQALKLAGVDHMNPYDFEQYVSRLLEYQGYHITALGGASDLGVDLIAKKGNIEYAVQVKRYAFPVTRRAVSDAVAGKAHYRCNAAMVVTNSSFTGGAKALARSTACILVERKTLAGWIFDFQGGRTLLRKVCPFCEGQNRQQARFCGYCGKPFVSGTPRQGVPLPAKVCPSCRKQNRQQAQFCGHCGKPF
jgi:hypothetical protein